MTDCELSIVMPCLDEAETLATCIEKARGFLERTGVAGEIVIADNGSSDGSQDIARSLGARVVDVSRKGYGAALMGGIRAARGRYVIMGDADDSYDFANLDPFLERLRAGCELVMGNRFRGGIKPGAMPPLHRYLGNPVLTGIGKLLFRSPCGDFHCGLRGFSKAAIEQLDLRTSGMEFASEMVVKATLHGLEVAEVPTTLSPDGRSRPPHLHSWRDGWRHLRFLLMFSPRWLFLLPGISLIVLGVLLMVAILPGPRTVAGITFDVHTLIGAAGMIVIGTQMITFGVLAKQHGIREGLLPEDPRITRLLEMFNLERMIMLGLLLVVLGVAGLLVAVAEWSAVNFGDLDYSVTMRIVIPAVTAMVTGVQMAISGFMSSILDLKVRR
ncbi:MAG: glycosyltransferase family 2 protein [Planctomycetota bacterium]